MKSSRNAAASTATSQTADTRNIAYPAQRSSLIFREKDIQTSTNASTPQATLIHGPPSCIGTARTANTTASPAENSIRFFCASPRIRKEAAART